MSAYQPPSYLVPIFNEEYFQTSSSGLTISDGDLRYLKLSGGTLTGQLFLTSGVGNSNGTVSLPSYSFSSDSSTGLYRIASGNIGIASSGTNILDISSTNINAHKGIIIDNFGSGISQIILKRPDTSTGFVMRNQSFVLVSGFTGGTVNDFLIQSTSGGANLILSGGDNGVISMIPGSSTSNQNVRIYGSNGTNYLLNHQLTTSGTNCQQIILSSNSATSPNYSFIAESNTGMYLAATNQLGFTVAGTQRLSVRTTSVSSTVPVLASDGLVSAVGLGFSNFPSTGFYMNAADLSIARNGVAVLNITNTINNTVGHIRSYLSESGASYTIGTDKDVVSMTTSTSTITLPSASGNRGRSLVISNNSAGSITIQRAGTDNIGSTNTTSITLATNRAVRLTAVSSTHWAQWNDI